MTPALMRSLAPSSDFLDAMSTLASGVVLVTTWVGGRPWGMTVTSFASASADPPTVLVALGSETTAARAIATTGRFGVGILAEEQAALARLCSVPGAAKFLEPFDWGTETPAVAGALAHLDCELSDVVETADHTIVFGRVRAARASGGGAPLLYHRRAYRRLAARMTTERRLACLSS